MDLQEAKTTAGGTVQLAEELKAHADQLSEFIPQLNDLVQSTASAAALEAHEALLDALDTAGEKATELANALSAVSPG
jgi:ABC-type transporter Mla subunit MlaD